ncbi:MAG: serine protease [Xanthobacteraceae bacterium]
MTQTIEVLKEEIEEMAQEQADEAAKAKVGLPAHIKAATQAVIRVNGEDAGRGFVVKAGHLPVVITAAHCLPHLPPPHLGRFRSEYNYEQLLGPLGGKATVWAECLFVDPMSDVAVLGEPDGQAFYEQNDAYYELTDDIEPLRIAPAKLFPLPEAPHCADMRVPHTPAWMLSLDGTWFCCGYRSHGRFLQLQTEAPIQGGMSGSPILDNDGAAIGLVSISSGGRHAEGTCASLAEALPGWLRRQMT